MLSPISLLSIFCGVMVVVSIGRLVRSDHRDPVDFGTVVILVGITVLSLLWVAIDTSLTVPGVQLALGLTGTGLLGIGIVLVAHYWERG